MVLTRGDVRIPVRVHGPTGLEIAADPRDEILLTDLLTGMGAVMDEHDAHAGLHLLVEKGELLGLVLAAGIGVNDDGIDIIKLGHVFRPFVDDLGLDAQTALVEVVSEQNASGTMFVSANRMASSAGEKENLAGFLFGFLGGCAGGDQGESNERGENAFHGRSV